MKDEYDFSAAKRGQFFRKGAWLVPPAHPDPEVLDYLRAYLRSWNLRALWPRKTSN